MNGVDLTSSEQEATAFLRSPSDVPRNFVFRRRVREKKKRTRKRGNVGEVDFAALLKVQQDKMAAQDKADEDEERLKREAAERAQAPKYHPLQVGSRATSW